MSGQKPPVSRIDRLVHEPSRLAIISYLYAVDEADFVFLVHHTGMTWGNISVHISKLESAGYVKVKKEFLGKKPHTVVSLSARGRQAFEDYRKKMKAVIE